MEEGKKIPEGENEILVKDTRKNDPQSTDPLRRLLSVFKLCLTFIVKLYGRISTFLTHFFNDGDAENSTAADLRRAFSHLNFKILGFGSIVLALALYLFTGIYVVNPGEVAIVKLFGKVVNENIGEGIHYRLPWPIEEAAVVNVASIRREGIGTVLPEHKSVHSSPDIIQFLTGDENIIDIQAVVQYRVKDAQSYLYNVKYPPYLLINETIRSAITEIGGSMQVDEILTVGKEHLQRLIREGAQRALDQYKSGLQLVGVNLNKVYPPEEVAEAFRDVSNAKQDREKTINDSWGYKNTVIPQARGDANRLFREGEAYKSDVINRASGEAARFDKMLVEYQTNNQLYTVDVTRFRLYTEVMERVMSGVKKYMVNTSKSGKVNLRLIDSE